MRTISMMRINVGMILLLALALAGCLNDAGTEAAEGVEMLFVLGDSLADAGNNNFIQNSTAKANFPPYGMTFFHRPTGRFTNGRSMFDFIAKRLGLPFAPPYLDPTANLTAGANFASGGSGLLENTGQSYNIISFEKQLQYLQQHLSKLPPERNLSRALFAISIGGNDVGLNYLRNATLQNSTTPAQFIQSLISHYQQYLRRLYQMGARNVLVMDMGLLGCTPGARAKAGGACLDSANAMVLRYNQLLRETVQALNYNYNNHDLHGIRLLMLNTSGLMMQALAHPKKYGFCNIADACCGNASASVDCGSNGNTRHCRKVERHYFWDNTHPTEHVHRLAFETLWSAHPPLVYPANLRTLVATLAH